MRNFIIRSGTLSPPRLRGGKRNPNRVRGVGLSLLLAISSPAAVEARLLIAEIHYHPQGTPEDAEALEFIEIYNDEPLPFDISDYQLQGGITYTFSAGTVVAARSAVTVAKNPERLAAHHRVALPLGPFAGRLGNDGDEVLLLDTGGSTVCRVPYNDRDRWPAAADGAGPSLSLKDPQLDPGESESWGWSVTPGGTPGVSNFEVSTAELLINEVFRTGAGDGWVELFNPGPAALDPSGYRLWGDPAGSTAFVAPQSPSIPARGFFVLRESALGFPLNVLDQILVLVAPGAPRVVDARRLAEALPGASDGRHPDGAERWYRLPTPSEGSANIGPPEPTVAINEIQYRPYSEAAAEEFIELVNTGTEAVNLEGFAFTSGVDYVFPPGSTIAPGGYLVLAADPNRIAERHGLSGVHGPWTGVLANAGELLRLRDRIGNPIDEVRYYDDGNWSTLADGHGPSLELVDPRQDNRNGQAWSASDHAVTSQWVEYEYTGIQKTGDSELHLYLLGAGETLIDDLQVIPTDGDINHLPSGNFEGANPLSGWVIDGTHLESRLQPGAGPDGSNALRIVASRRGDSGANRIERQTTPNLTAGKEYRVRFKARWLAGSDLLMTRSWGHGIARVHRLSVPALGGTPGRKNSRFAANTGPVITAIEQEPALPMAGEPVIVRAAISDPDGVASVTLWSRLDGAANFAASSLKDDGLDPDALAGDSVYSGQIEGMGSRGATAEFYLLARDSLGHERTAPAQAPELTQVYSYDDGVAETNVPSFRLVQLRRHHDTLVTRSAFSNSHLPATLVVGRERTFPQAQLRYRGSPYLRRQQITGSRKGFRVRLHREDALSGAVRVTLDEQEVDPTLQVDRLVRHFLQKAGGVPYGERRHAHLIVRGASFGTYEQVMTVDPLYLKRSFGDNDQGELYKVDAHYEINDANEFAFPRFTSWKFTEEKEDLRFIYKKRSAAKEDDFTGLMQLLDLMDTSRTSNEAFDERAGALLDLDLFVKGIAVYRAVEDWDAIGGWTGKNIYLYHHPDGRWRFIPWDHDISFGSAALQADQNPRAYLYTPYFPEIRRLLQRPLLDRKFNAELLRLMDEDYDRARVDPVLNATHEFLRASSGAEAPVGIKSFITARRAHILSQIKDPAAFTLETNDGNPFATSEPSTLLSGKAPFRVVTILVNGKTASIHWKTREVWELSTELAPGENALRLEALSETGSLMGSASIQITYNTATVQFTRGDANRDEKVDLSDAVTTLLHLFAGDALNCPDAADVDDSGLLNITDPIALLRYLFQGGPEPAPPFVVAGTDTTADALGCAG